MQKTFQHIFLTWGAHARQKSLHGTLSDIREKVRKAKLIRTALIFVGRVLGEAEFRDSALYDGAHPHVLRPKRRAG